MMMFLFAIFGCLFVIYYIVYAILWILLDCNVKLWWKSHFGTPISALRGQVVWITGASSGIGKSLALQLARHGVRLVLSARRSNLLEQIKEECLNAAQGLLAERDVLVLPMDVVKMDSHLDNLNKVLNHFGQLNILVNNAGRSQRANWVDIDVQVDRDIFELDVFSVLHLSRLVVRYFIEQNGGKGQIAATSSLAGLTPTPFSASYCAAKHALNAYLSCLALEHPNIDVVLFHPGPVATDFLQEAFTATPNSKYGRPIEGQKRLSPERCSYLFAVALANKMEIVWCALFPVNVIAYIIRYTILSNILRYFMGKSTMHKIREGKL